MTATTWFPPNLSRMLNFLLSILFLVKFLLYLPAKYFSRGQDIRRCWSEQTGNRTHDCLWTGMISTRDHWHLGTQHSRSSTHIPMSTFSRRAFDCCIWVSGCHRARVFAFLAWVDTIRFSCSDPIQVFLGRLSLNIQCHFCFDETCLIITLVYTTTILQSKAIRILFTVLLSIKGTEHNPTNNPTQPTCLQFSLWRVSGMDGNLITSWLWYGEVGWVWEVVLVAVMEEVSPFVVDEIFLVDNSAT